MDAAGKKLRNAKAAGFLANRAMPTNTPSKCSALASSSRKVTYCFRSQWGCKSLPRDNESAGRSKPSE